MKPFGITIQYIFLVVLLLYSGGERGSHSPFPKPIVGAVLATNTGEVLSSGRSNYEEDAVEAVVRNAGIKATPLSEWCVSWPDDPALRSNLRNSTLYITLEPSSRRKGYVCVSIWEDSGVFAVATSNN